MLHTFFWFMIFAIIITPLKSKYNDMKVCVCGYEPHTRVICFGLKTTTTTIVLLGADTQELDAHAQNYVQINYFKLFSNVTH